MGFCDSCGDEYSGELLRINTPSLFTKHYIQLCVECSIRIMNELCFQLEIRGVSCVLDF